MYMDFNIEPLNTPRGGGGWVDLAHLFDIGDRKKFRVTIPNAGKEKGPVEGIRDVCVCLFVFVLIP